MSKRRTKPEDIRNPVNYFNSFIALEIERERERQKAYHEMFDSLEEMLAGGSEGVSGETLMRFATNLHGDEFERCIEGTYSLDWIEIIENPRLYAAVKSLSHKDKWLLTLRYKYCLTQRDIAPLFNMSQAAICQRESSIKNQLKNFSKMLIKNRDFISSSYEGDFFKLPSCNLKGEYPTTDNVG